MEKSFQELQHYFLLDGRNHFISMKAQHWFKTCFLDSENNAWSEATAANIEGDLRAHGVQQDLP